MILLDYSAVAIANIMFSIKREGEILTNPFALHMILNSIRRANKQFSSEFGSMIICCDGGNNWRKRVFPFYKYKRKKDKKMSDVDWDLIYECLDFAKKEINDGFPYQVVEDNEAEADDIIGILAKHSTNTKEHTVVVSNDKDFVQRHSEFVCQWRPCEKAFVRNPDPKLFLKELILRGDSDDGVPNIKSPDNIFTLDGVKQKSMFKKELDIWLYDDDNMFLEELDIKIAKTFKKGETINSIPSKNFVRNRQLIDLDYTPSHIKDRIMNSFNKGTKKANKSKMVKFFMKNKLRFLQERINDFM